MRVCLLGAGSIAYAMAAFLAEAGHRPVLWSPSGRSAQDLAEGEPLVATGAVETTGAVVVAATCAEAVAGADAVVVALPGYGHRAVMEAAAPHLAPGQPVIVSSHASFGALYLSKLLAARGVAVPIAAWGTTVVTGRKRGGAQIHVNTVREKVAPKFDKDIEMKEGTFIFMPANAPHSLQADEDLAILLCLTK